MCARYMMYMTPHKLISFSLEEGSDDHKLTVSAIIH